MDELIVSCVLVRARATLIGDGCRVSKPLALACSSDDTVIVYSYSGYDIYTVI